MFVNLDRNSFFKKGHNPFWLWPILLIILVMTCSHSLMALSVENGQPPVRQKVQALYIPLADHYAALVAYERYGKQMRYADFQLQQMKSWDLLRAYFQSGEVDMAYVMSPLAMDMYQQKPTFRWIGLMHRDGNALAINDLLNAQVKLPKLRKARKPDEKIATALKQVYQQSAKSIEIALPHLLATHTVVLYQYLKKYDLRLSLVPNNSAEVLAIAVPPPKSPVFLRSKSNRAQAAAFEQSLPWADIVETNKFGHVAWYSKDVLPWPKGHVECIALATDAAIAEKFDAIKEVMKYIHLAGEDIEQARNESGKALEDIVDIIRKYIPSHSREAIIASLDADLRVINYQSLNLDKDGLKLIMDLAVEAGILKQAIDIHEFADTRFAIGNNETRLENTEKGAIISDGK